MDKPMVITDKKFALYGKPVDGGRGMPKMTFDVYRGNPSITVFTNDPADPDGKPIRAKMDPAIFGTFIATCRQVLDAEPGEQFRLVNRTGHPKKTFVDSITIVGKSPEGVVYLALNKQDKPTKRFNILPTVYSDLADSQGNPIPDGVKSVLYAKGFINMLDAFVTQYITETYEPPQPQPQQGGNRGGGGGNYGQGGGNYQGGNRGGGGNNNYQGGGGGAAPGSGVDQSFEDDLPM